MKNELKDNDQDAYGGNVVDVELAQNDKIAEKHENDFQMNKMNSADTLAGAKFRENGQVAENEQSSNSCMKKCFIGICIVGAVAFITVIAMIATSGKENKVEPCPPYHYRDPKAKFEDTDVGEDVLVAIKRMDDDRSVFKIQQDQGVCVRATCDFRSEIMAKDGSCSKCSGDK